MEENDHAPTRDDKAKQLERMLVSEVFTKAPKLAEFLKYLVERDLKGSGTDEHTIGIEVFGRKEDWDPSEDNIVRQNRLNLRKRLSTYYTEEGAQDLVTVDVPNGYIPVFNYNSRTAADEQCQRGLFHIAHLSSRPTLSFAIGAFEEAIKAEPNYGLAYAYLAEAKLLKAFYSSDLPPEELLVAAETSAQDALRCNPDLCLPHIILGAVHSCRWNWDEAFESFDAAVKADYSTAMNSPWYAAFTLAASTLNPAGSPLVWGDWVFDSVVARRLYGNAQVVERYYAQQALATIELFAKERPGSTFARCLHALFLFVVGDTDESSGFEVWHGEADADIATDWFLQIMFELTRPMLSGPG
jgi:tetratricopeptide (TPR) repeat protein